MKTEDDIVTEIVNYWRESSKRDEEIARLEKEKRIIETKLNKLRNFDNFLANAPAVSELYQKARARADREGVTK